MRKMKLVHRAFISGVAFTLFAAGFAVRFLSLPAWVDLTIAGIVAAPVVWVARSELIKRRAEKRFDEKLAWRIFVRDRKVR
ncbi:hypothetical protein WG907_14960 [Sphingobium sp. AN558]|uniref:hypothetical protein n=1 Tax=Sphingobium sp. AN558 TaxID=3133442 RepID=UPI0030C3F6A3